MSVTRDNPTRTARQVLDDLEGLLAALGDDSPLVEVVLSGIDFLLIRGIAGDPSVNLVRDYPSATKALKMHVRIEPGYNGRPRILRTIGAQGFDAHAELERRTTALERHSWRETDERLRRGIDGRRLA